MYQAAQTTPFIGEHRHICATNDARAPASHTYRPHATSNQVGRRTAYEGQFNKRCSLLHLPAATHSGYDRTHTINDAASSTSAANTVSSGLAQDMGMQAVDMATPLACGPYDVAVLD